MKPFFLMHKIFCIILMMVVVCFLTPLMILLFFLMSLILLQSSSVHLIRSSALHLSSSACLPNLSAPLLHSSPQLTHSSVLHISLFRFANPHRFASRLPICKIFVVSWPPLPPHSTLHLRIVLLLHQVYLTLFPHIFLIISFLMLTIILVYLPLTLLSHNSFTKLSNILISGKLCRLKLVL
jgi:hypothetical protein